MSAACSLGAWHLELANLTLDASDARTELASADCNHYGQAVNHGFELTVPPKQLHIFS